MRTKLGIQSQYLYGISDYVLFNSVSVNLEWIVTFLWKGELLVC